ncbi:hypothetical protein ABZ714_34425 [Streptomyces sp. NPDC006798]|uniref:hypothetical protein n=1 Tax=Streptomyces sp. NPDC006798 TaxID=3155462 RepID=UPI0033C5C455
MPDQPIVPTRIIPPGVPLPSRPPAPGETPPWRPGGPTNPPAPPSPPPPPSSTWPPAEPPPGPLEVRVTVDLAPATPPKPKRTLWDRLTDWRLATAVLAAVAPWAGGTSPVSAWSTTLADARTEASPLAAYTLAIGTAALCWWLDRRSGRWLPRMLLVTTLIGSTGAIHLFDPITALTGVTP